MDTSRRGGCFWSFGLLVLFFGLWGPKAGAQVQLTIVAKGGDAAPGLNDSFGVFSQAMINNSGQVAFFGAPSLNARFAGPMGVYLWSGGNLQVVAKTGDSVPGAPAGATLLTTSPGGFSDTGQVVIGGYLQGPGISPGDIYGFWVG